MPTLTGKKCINFLIKPMIITKTKKYSYRLPRSESFLFPSRLPSALVAWETCLCRCDRCSSLRSSSRIIAVVPVLSSTVATMAALESITLLIYPRYRFVRLASRATSCTSAMMEFMPCALTPAIRCDFDMPFRPGCHCPFHRSYRRPLVASAVTGVARRSVWSSLY